MWVREQCFLKRAQCAPEEVQEMIHNLSARFYYQVDTDNIKNDHFSADTDMDDDLLCIPNLYTFGTT